MRLVLAAIFIEDGPDQGVTAAKALGASLGPLKAPDSKGDLVIFDPTVDAGLGVALNKLGLTRAAEQWYDLRRIQHDQESS